MSNFELEYPDTFKRKATYSDKKEPMFEPAQIFSLGDLEKIVNDNLEADLYKLFSDLSAYFQKFTGYQWGNTHYYLHDYSSTLFKFMFGGKDLTIWDIHDFTVYVGKFNRLEIACAIKKYERGIIQCSKCRQDMDFKENRSHRYFAGIYCLKCWEGGMKQIEAKENYN